MITMPKDELEVLADKIFATARPENAPGLEFNDARYQLQQMLAELDREPWPDDQVAELTLQIAAWRQELDWATYALTEIAP